MPTRRGTRTDLMPKVDVPLITATAPTPAQTELAKLGITGDISFAGGSRVRQTEEVPQDRRLEQSEVFRDRETGLPSGITTPGGQTFLGLSPGDVERVAEGERRKVELPAGTQLVGTQAQQLAEQQRMAEVASRIGAQPQQQQGMMGQQAGMEGQRTPLDTRQAWAFALSDPSSISAMAQFGGGLALGAKFALAGTKAGAVLGPWGVVAGAVGGLALGIYTSYRRNIQQQTTGNMNAQMEAYTQGNQYLRRVEGLINSDPENAGMYLDLANEAEARMRQAWTQMQIDTSTNLNLALGKDGTAQMAKFEEYFRENGMADLYKQRWRIALSAPNQELGVQQLLMASMEMGGEE
jgi:hypothetical protein